MKTSGKILLIYLVIVGWSCIPEQEIPWSDDLWKKGNLHTHSFWSDGDDYPENKEGFRLMIQDYIEELCKDKDTKGTLNNN